MKIQDERQLLGAAIRDVGGRRVGRVVAVQCAPDPYTAAWLVLRLRGRRRRCRAIPGSALRWLGQDGLCVPFRRDLVANSPALVYDGVEKPDIPDELADFYAGALAS